MASLVHGLLAGILLTRWQHPLGRELLDVPAVPAGTALAARSTALLAVALAVLLARPSLEGRTRGTWLAGLALGAAGEGLLARFGRESDGGNLVFAALGLVLFALREARRGASRSARSASPPPLARGALALAGAGLALGFEGLARLVRRLGPGLVADDAVLTAVLSALLALGALGLGRALPGGRAGEARPARSLEGIALGLAGAALVASLAALVSQSSPQGLRASLARFGLDPADCGSARVDGVLGLVAFVLPALFAGAALHGLRRRDELASLVVGAAFGLQLVPPLLAPSPGASLAELARSGPHAGRLVAVGVGLVAAGVLLDALARRARKRSAASLAQALVGVALLVPALALRGRPLPAPPPWSRFPQPVALAFETPEGRFLVQPGPVGLGAVTLDHRPIAPPAAGARLDAECLRRALALLPAPVRERGARVLLVGQLTPGRALVLAEESVARLDRSAAWWREMERLEAEVFAATPQWRAAQLGLDGAVLSPIEARERVGAGEYDVVLVPPVAGRLPLVPRPDLPEGTIAVVWYDAESEAAARDFGAPLLVAADGLERLALGAVFGLEQEPAAEPRAGTGPFVAAGGPSARGRTVAWMRERVPRRGPRSLAALAERLAHANSDNGWRLVTRAFAEHASVQEESSPWATSEEATELDEGALVSLVEALSTGARDPWSEELAGGLARVLRGKRDVEGIWRWIEPIAAIWRPWRAGDLALALAEIESLDAPAAVARLEPLLAADPADVEVGELLARALREAGESARELALLRALFEGGEREPLAAPELRAGARAGGRGRGGPARRGSAARGGRRGAAARPRRGRGRGSPRPLSGRVGCSACSDRRRHPRAGARRTARRPTASSGCSSSAGARCRARRSSRWRSA